MPLPKGYEFVDLTSKFAEEVQRLTLEDLQLIGFENPTQLANPKSREKVEAQERKLREHPAQYCGVVHSGQLVGYMRLTELFFRDALPFARVLRRLWLWARRVFRRSYLPGRPLGVVGLVVSEDRCGDEYIDVLSALLERAFEEAQGRKVYIIVADVSGDGWFPLLLRMHGFKRIGRPGEAAGAPGAMQVLYERPATS